VFRHKIGSEALYAISLSVSMRLDKLIDENVAADRDL